MSASTTTAPISTAGEVRAGGMGGGTGVSNVYVRTYTAMGDSEVDTGQREAARDMCHDCSW
jgi:hypothetical protein